MKLPTTAAEVDALPVAELADVIEAYAELMKRAALRGSAASTTHDLAAAWTVEDVMARYHLERPTVLRMRKLRVCRYPGLGKKTIRFHPDKVRRVMGERT